MHRPHELEIWVLAGQSNMEGVGALTEALPPDPRVWSFTSAGQWEVAEEPLHRFWESCTPVHQELCRPGLPEERKPLSDAELAALQRQERTHGTGLGIAFGKMLADRLGRPIGLIPAAHGGTSLDQWSSRLKDRGGHSLYGAMLERIARAAGTVRGILWYQGESDAWDDGLGASYQARMQQWIADVRADLGQPDLPVLMVQLGRTTLDSPSARAWDAVRQAQVELPRYLPQVGVTSAVDLGLVDPIHINARGLERLGRRLANQALVYAYGQSAPSGPRLVSMTARTLPGGQGEVRLTCCEVTGGWQPEDNMAGFDVYAPDGTRPPHNYVYNAFRDPTDPTAILVHLNLPLRDGDLLGYGQGLHPYCNVTDAADMPLCAFRMG